MVRQCAMSTALWQHQERSRREFASRFSSCDWRQRFGALAFADHGCDESQICQLVGSAASQAKVDKASSKRATPQGSPCSLPRGGYSRRWCERTTHGFVVPHFGSDRGRSRPNTVQTIRPLERAGFLFGVARAKQWTGARNDQVPALELKNRDFGAGFDLLRCKPPRGGDRI